MTANGSTRLSAEEQNELAREMLGPNGDNGSAHRLARRIARANRELADDAATDAVLWAISKFDPELHRSFRALALSAVRRRVKSRLINFYRDQDRHGGELEFLGDMAGEVAAPIESTPPDGSLPLELRELLTDREQRAIRLYYVGGWSQAEVGRILGVDQSTVHDILKGAARKLNPNVKPQGL